MADEKKKKNGEKFTITTNADTLAKNQTMYMIQNGNFAYNGERNPVFKFEVNDKTKNDDIFSYNTNTEDEKDSNSEISAKDVKAPKTREEIVQQIADEKFSEFMKNEQNSIDNSINELKTELADDYDNYLEMIKNTEYYQKSVKKWEEYYKNKRREFEIEAENTVKKIDDTAKKQAIEQTPIKTEGKIIAMESTDEEEDTSDWSYDYFKKSIRLNAKEIKCDPALKKTIEQILLDELYNSFDENRDAYSRELSDLEGMKRIPKVYRDIVESRLHISENLVQSYTKLFDMTDNKTVKKIYGRNAKAINRDLETYKNDMDSSLATDMVMNQLYGMDFKTKEITGLIPEIAEYLAVRVQQELIKRDRAEFNLYKGACQKILNDVLLETKFATKIVEKNRDVKVDTKVAYLKEMEKLLKALKKDVKEDTRHVTPKLVQKATDSLKKLKSSKYAFDETTYDDILTTLEDIEAISIQLSNSKPEDISAESKKAMLKLIKNIELRNNQMFEAAKKQDMTRAEKNINKRYESDNVEYKFDENGKLSSVLPKRKGLRPITDWIAKKVMESIGSKAVRGELKTYQFTQKDRNELKTEVIDVLDEERNPEVDFTRYLLFYIQCAEHDIREMVKEENNYKYKYTQGVLDTTTKLLKSFEALNNKNEDEFRKQTINVINDYISLSNDIKPEGKARRKSGLEEAKAEYTKN